MVIGIAMMKVLPGKERSVYWFLKGIEGIEELYHVFGEYDLFVIMQAEGIGKLNELMNDIKRLQDVIMSRTILVGWDRGILQEHNILMRKAMSNSGVL
jgi:DNA-binding Lrp family transcriptional regulator